MVLEIMDFLKLKPVEQTDYLNNTDFFQLTAKQKITFLKQILTPQLTPSVTILALRELRRLDYPDRYYFRKFLYHIDLGVAEEARQAIRSWECEKKEQCTDIVNVLLEGKSADRMLLADHFLEAEGKLNEEVLISFLTVDDCKVRESIINRVSLNYELDESVLSECITRGTTWFVRAALVEILGNRKSMHLFDIIDFLVKDKNVEVKLKLINALLNFERESRNAYLKKLSADSLIWVRKEALRALHRG